MSLRYLLVLILAINASIQIFSQQNKISITLEWGRNSTEMSASQDNRKTFLGFKGAVYDENSMLPVKTIQTLWNKNVSFKVLLSNANYQIIEDNSNWGQELIKNEIEFQHEISTLKGQSFALIHFVPIRKNNLTGRFEKLVSADLQIIADDKVQSIGFESTKSFNNISKLNDGLIYKISIPNSAVYKIDYNFLKNMGIDVDNIDPRKIQLLGNGGKMLPEIAGSNQRIDDLMENAIWIEGENDGRFDANDYILFYGIGKDSWKFEASSSMFFRTENIYTDQITYFLKIASSNGKRISNRASISGTNYSSSSYDALDHFEENKLNLMEKEFALPPSGRLWLGNSFQISRSQNFNFNFANRINSEPVKMQTVLYGRAFTSSTYEIKANGNSLLSSSMSAVNNYIYSLYARKQSNFSNFTSTSNNININIIFNNSSSTAEAWLDYITLNARCQLIFNGSQMSFRDKNSIGQITANYNIQNANSAVIWDLTFPYDIENQQYTGTGNINFGCNADTLREFVIFNVNSLPSPSPGSIVQNQNLHSITTAPNFLIVYHKNFQSAAQRLASHRANHSNISVLSVDVEQIYNEFSSGNPDISAVRDFAKMLYERSSGNDSLRYLLLFGNGSFDYKGLGINRSKNNNYILAYETEESIDPLKTYTTDDYFALLDDGEGNLLVNNFLDIAVGRLSVISATEAEGTVDKIIRYDSDQDILGDWKNNLTFFADDQDGNLHLNDTESIAQSVAARDSVYNIDKIYIDAYPQVSTAGGSRYPDVNSSILRNIFKGNLIMSYLGHGGVDGLAQERIFTNTEINTLNNSIKLPLFITATCSFAPFDDPETVSAGQLLLLNPSGGCIALMTTVRVVLADANQHLTQKTFENVFALNGNRMPTIGEVLQNAKNNSGLLSASNSRKYVLLGDPSMTLAYPKNRVVTTALNGQPLGTIDTIRALQRVSISGEIRDVNDNFLSYYNGTIYPTVFDKADTIRTRANDADSRATQYPLQKKVIFKGRATVTNGRFTFSFIVPVDINYKLDFGKISYYAENGDVTNDAHGHYGKILIGGTDPNAARDDKGPDVKVFMNNENFASGGVTNANPLLFVKLNDESGINTVGNGIGHDLTGLLTFIQDDDENIYNLNDFYEANIDDFTSGTINYPIQNLPDGKHLMKVKAWDVYNNLGEGQTEFIVASSASMALNHIFNYPNPFTTHTEFMFEHNLPGQDLEVLIQVYTVSGKLVKTISKDISSTENNGFRVSGIEWDGLDDFGDKLAKGVYIYKLTLRSEGLNSSLSDQSTIQKNSEFQKLVILR
jgi:hypothetical protein